MSSYPSWLRLAHLAVVGPALIHSGLVAQNQVDMLPKQGYALLGVGGGVAAYHAYRLYQRVKQGGTATSYGVQINALHLAFAGLLGYTGYKWGVTKEPVPPIVGTLLIVLGGGAMVYHGKQLLIK